MKIEFLDLGKQPLANSFLSQEDLDKEEKKYPLAIGFDPKNFLVSLMNFVPSEEMFNSSYIYHSSHSPTLVDHFTNIAERLKKYVPRFGNILEIGCNDGVFLKNFGLGQGIGIEPCGNFAEIMTKRGYNIYNEFWTPNLAKQIKKDYNPIDVVYAANTMCHIPNIQEAFKGVSDILGDNGIFVFEDPSIIEMLKQNSYDQIYHEHAHIFSVIALQQLLKNAGLEIFKVESPNIHGGSSRIWASKIGKSKIEPSVSRHIIKELNYGLANLTPYDQFGERIRRSKYDLVRLLYALEKMNYNVVAFGATSKLNVVLNYCEIPHRLIKHIIDEMPSKQGKFSPGTYIPVVPFDRSKIKELDAVLLGCWNFKDDIVRKLKININWNGCFITHVPEVKIF